VFGVIFEATVVVASLATYQATTKASMNVLTNTIENKDSRGPIRPRLLAFSRMISAI
jgi:hypothetical protein